MLDYYTIFKKNDNETNTNNKSSFLKLYIYIYIYNLEKFFLAKTQNRHRKEKKQLINVTNTYVTNNKFYSF